jgi:hypothetical protein
MESQFIETNETIKPASTVKEISFISFSVKDGHHLLSVFYHVDHI